MTSLFWYLWLFSLAEWVPAPGLLQVVQVMGETGDRQGPASPCAVYLGEDRMDASVSEGNTAEGFVIPTWVGAVHAFAI